MKYESYLEHHGILGQKWGVRRFQNADGSLKAAGKKRYSNSKTSDSKEEQKKKGLSDKQKKAIKVGAVVVSTAAVVAGTAYVATKFSKNTKELASKKYIDMGEQAARRLIDTGERLSEHMSDKAIDLKNAGDREGYKKLKKEAASIRKQYSQMSSEAYKRSKDDASKIGSSFKDSFNAVYGKNKYSIPDYVLESMGIKVIK